MYLHFYQFPQAQKWLVQAQDLPIVSMLVFSFHGIYSSAVRVEHTLILRVSLPAL